MSTTLRRMMPDRTAAVYWRRRFVALLIGLSVLALASWACAGVLARSAQARNPAATTSLHRALPSTSAGSTGTEATAGAAGPKRTGHTAANGNALRCPAGDVVLSLFSGQASFSVRQTPEFEVDVVSTASRPCTFDIGARHLLLQVSAGSSRVWTSADCAEGQASLIAKLSRGVPTVVPIAWNGQHSSPGCPVPGAAASGGPYTATATTTGGAQSSNALTFRIG
jgi:hypothetical protein